MSNFLEFITEDIETRKTLLSTMPTKSKRDIKEYNEKIDEFISKYEAYKDGVKKYLEAKSESFNVKKKDDNLEQLKTKIEGLERCRFLLNPLNTYFEKMSFDSLLYEVSNYTDFDFGVLNDTLNKLLDKFKSAGIKLSYIDFDYTPYVNEYMREFLEVQNNKDKDYSKVSEKFEQIYWVNPEIIQHIELNFRKIITKHEKKIINYIIELQKETMRENNVTNYENCLTQLKKAYQELNVANTESINDIIDMAKTNVIDINNYFEDSKVRMQNYTSLMINPIELKDKEKMEEFYEDMQNLIVNLEEYSNYIKFLPLIESFKKEYTPYLASKDIDTVFKTLKTIKSEIKSKENKLNKLNKKINGGIFGSVKENASKQLKLDAIKQAKELYELYKKHDEESFKHKVLGILNSSLTIEEVLNLYYSFDYFKKNAIKNSFEITNHDEMVSYSEKFDLFVMNLDNIIIKGVLLFEENDISKVLVNRYRLDEININKEDLEDDNLVALKDKVKFLLRIKTIEESATTLEKIWFMVQVHKIKLREEKPKL